MAAAVTRSLFSPAYGRLREILVAARHERQLSQANVARTLGRPQTFVSKYERGERRLDVVELVEVARALELDPAGVVMEIARRVPGADPSPHDPAQKGETDSSP